MEPGPLVVPVVFCVLAPLSERLVHAEILGPLHGPHSRFPYVTKLSKPVIHQNGTSLHGCPGPSVHPATKFIDAFHSGPSSVSPAPVGVVEPRRIRQEEVEGPYFRKCIYLIINILRNSIIHNAHGCSICIHHPLEVGVLILAQHSVFHPSGLHRFGEITCRCHQKGKRFPGNSLPFFKQGNLFGVIDEPVELSHAVERGKVGNRYAGKIPFAEGAVGQFHSPVTGRQQVAGRPHQEKVIGGVTHFLDEIACALHFWKVVLHRLPVAARQEELGLHHQTGGGSLIKPVVAVKVPVALLVDDLLRSGTITEAPVGGHQRIKGAGVRRLARLVDPTGTLAVALVVPEEIERPLHNREPWLSQEGCCCIGQAITVLYPPGVPSAALQKGVPLRLVEHRDVRYGGVRMKAGKRLINQAEKARVAFTAAVFTGIGRLGWAGKR